MRTESVYPPQSPLRDPVVDSPPYTILDSMVSFVHLPPVLSDLPGLNESLRQALNTANPRTSLQLGTAKHSMF
ncbi:hypothetical protein A2U01_0038341, partial [Trifolium medium]|nr:hypothetical protein [Trifolium medium]